MSDDFAVTPSTRHLSRTRGLTSGLLLVLLGVWGALAPFIGPLFSFAFTPDTSWHWTAARGWYEVLPGGVTALGGLLLLAATSRGTTLLGAWLGVVGGAWFVIGPPISGQLSLGSIGEPTGDSGAKRALEILAFFYLLGAVILFLAAAAFGRLSVVTVRDVRVAERRAEAEEIAAREAAEREAAEREAAVQAAQREAAQREAAERDAAQREAAQREAAQREAAQREAAQREAAERDAAQRDAAQRDAAQRDAAQQPAQQPAQRESVPDDQQAYPPPPPPGWQQSQDTSTSQAWRNAPTQGEQAPPGPPPPPGSPRT